MQFTDRSIFSKICTDRGLTSGTTYTSDYKKDVDLSIADVYFYYSGHPDFTEGKLSIKFTKGQLLRMRRKLYMKYGLTPPEYLNNPYKANAIKEW